METEKLEGRFSNQFLSFSFQIKRTKKMGGRGGQFRRQRVTSFIRKKNFPLEYMLTQY